MFTSQHLLKNSEWILLSFYNFKRFLSLFAFVVKLQTLRDVLMDYDYGFD